MNERILELLIKAGFTNAYTDPKEGFELVFVDEEHTTESVAKFAELIVEECRTVVSEVYRKTPLELCGPLLTADEEIAKHFYGVEA